MKRLITVCACLCFLCTPVMAQNNNFYTKIKRHIAQKIAHAEEQRKAEALQKYDAELAVWTNALGGNIETAKKFYAKLGEIQHGLDVFYLPQGVSNLVGDDENKIAYSTEPVVVVVSWHAVYTYLSRNCTHQVTVYNLNAQPLYDTGRNHKIAFVDPATHIQYWYNRFQSGLNSNKGNFKRYHPYIIDNYCDGYLSVKGY